MSAEEAVVLEADEAEPVGESGGMSERTARAILLVVAFGALVGIIAAFPWLAYVIVGILGTLGWQKMANWRARRRGADEDEPEAEEEPDVVDALTRLGRGGRNVLLTELRDELGVADTKTVRALLDAASIRVRPGVRTPAGNGPGVHGDDIPALSRVADGPQEGGCCCRSDANANANNDTEEEPEEGVRVVPIGTDGKIVYDPRDTIRHHRVQ